MDFAIPTGKTAHGTPSTGGTAGTHSTGGVSRTGTLMGMAVAQVPAPVSVVDDAVEMGLLASETMADELSLEEFEQDREVDDERRERIQKYKEIMDKDHGKIHRLEAMQDFLDSRHERRDNQRQISRFFSNPTELYVALGYILSSLEVEAPAATSPATSPVEGAISTQDAVASQDANARAAKAAQASEIRWLMDDLEERHGPRIHADMVGALHGSEFGDLGQHQALGGFYGQTLCDFSSVNDVFAHVHSNFGIDGFDRAIDFLFGALGADMASHRPSMEMTHLEHVQKNLGQVRLMQTVFLQCQSLLERWEGVHQVRDCGLTPLSLSGQLVDLRQFSYLGSMHIETIAAQAKAPDVEREVLFLQEMLTMVRALPPRLFDGDEGRMKVLEATQQAVDKAVEREDVWLASH